jgi:hypothetical protein
MRGWTRVGKRIAIPGQGEDREQIMTKRKGKYKEYTTEEGCTDNISQASVTYK